MVTTKKLFEHHIDASVADDQLKDQITKSWKQKDAKRGELLKRKVDEVSKEHLKTADIIANIADNKFEGLIR